MKELELRKLLGELSRLEEGDEFTYEIKRAPKRKPWPKVRVCGGDELSGSYCRTRSLIVEPDKITALPRHGDSDGYSVDLKTLEVTRERRRELGGGFIGSYAEPGEDGRQWAFPGDPAARHFLSYRKGEWFKVFPRDYSLQIRSGVVDGDNLICAVFDRGPRAWGVNLETGRAFDVPFSEDLKFHAERKRHLFKGCVAGWGQTYLLPWNSYTVGKVSKRLNQVIGIGDIVSIGGTGEGMYSSGVFVKELGKSFSLAHRGEGVLVIDHATDRVREIPMPEIMRARFKHSVSYTTVLGPDGLIYGAPTRESLVPRFDPVTEEFDFLDISGDLERAGVKLETVGYGYATDAKTVGNRIFYGAGGVNRPFCLEF